MWNPKIYSESVYEEFKNTGIREMLAREAWEDGMANASINCTELYINKDGYAVIKLLTEIARDAVANNNWHLLAGVLRTVAWVTIESTKSTDIAYFLGYMSEALLNGDSEAQEAAIMLAEEWRTQECYELLSVTTFNSEWISEYAKKVTDELRIELGQPKTVLSFTKNMSETAEIDPEIQQVINENFFEML